MHEAATQRARGPGLEQHGLGRLLDDARGSLQLLIRLLHRDHNPNAEKERHRTWSESSRAPASARQVLLGGGAASRGPAAYSPLLTAQHMQQGPDGRAF